MTDKKEGPAPRPGDSQAPKRPHATLDLTATEVKTGTPAAPAAAAASGSDTKPAQTSDTQSKPAASADEPAADSSRTAKPDARADKPSPARPAEPSASAASPATKPTVPPRKRGGFVTHLVAGLAGGALSLFAARAFGPEIDTLLGLEGMPASGVDKRLEALEVAARQDRGLPDIAAKLAAAEARLAPLEEAAAALATLKDDYAKLESETKALTGRLIQEAPAADAGRLAKLEDRLATLAAASGSDADKGRIQGLAAVTGKLADLETGTEAKLAAQKKGILDEIGERLSETAAASESARAGTERIDRDVASLRTEAARLAQRIEDLKAEDARLTAHLQAAQEGTAATTSALTTLKGSLESQLGTVARSTDVASAVSPIAGRLGSVEKSLAELAKAEAGRKSNAARVLVSLELANLKRAVDRGAPFATELASARKAAGSDVAGIKGLDLLDPLKESGVAAMADLEREFKPLVGALLVGGAGQQDSGSFFERLFSGAKTAIKVRKVTNDANDTAPEAVVGRIEDAMKENRLADVLEIAKAIPADVAPMARDWLGKVEARLAADKAIAAVESEIKASLTSGAAPDAAPAGSAGTMNN